MSDEQTSYIIIDQDVEQSFNSLLLKFQGKRVVKFYEDDFKVEHAKAVVAEAYISEESFKYIIIATKNFTPISQNALLKIFEEPPRNIIFIIIVPSKSMLLPTIRSRLPVHKQPYAQQVKTIEFNFQKIDNAMIFALLKGVEKMKKHEAKELLEALFYRATVVDKLILGNYQLECFEKAYKLLELNSRAVSVFALVLMSFLGTSDAD